MKFRSFGRMLKDFKETVDKLQNFQEILRRFFLKFKKPELILKKIVKILIIFYVGTP